MNTSKDTFIRTCNLLRQIGCVLVPTVLLHLCVSQPLEINWFTIDGGGGTSSGGQFTLSGTIGQADTGILTGGSYTLVGGFWSIPVAVSGPPELDAALAGDEIVISWPASARNYSLEQTTAIGPDALWRPADEPPVQIGNYLVVRVIAGPGDRFYRLRRP